MDENLNIIQEIMILAIKIDQMQHGSIEVNYHSATKKLTISICTDGNPTFNDGLTRSWWVSAKNTELLKTVLNELKKLDISILDNTNNPIDDFLG